MGRSWHPGRHPVPWRQPRAAPGPPRAAGLAPIGRPRHCPSVPPTLGSPANDSAGPVIPEPGTRPRDPPVGTAPDSLLHVRLSEASAVHGAPPRSAPCGPIPGFRPPPYDWELVPHRFAGAAAHLSLEQQTGKGAGHAAVTLPCVRVYLCWRTHTGSATEPAESTSPQNPAAEEDT